MNVPLILSVESSLYFAERIAAWFGAWRVVSIEHKCFAGGERYYRVAVDEREELIGRDAVFVASTHSDDELNEVCRVGETLAKSGVRRIIFAISFFGYSTMERATLPGEAVTAKIAARQLSQIASGDMRNCFLMLDLHTAGLVHYFEGNVLAHELYAEDALVSAIRDLGLQNLVMASADLGRAHWVQSFARRLDVGVAFIDKRRTPEKTTVHYVVGDVAGKTVVIYDDMTRSGGTLIDAARAYLAEGASSVSAVVSHLALDDPMVVFKLENSPIVRVIATNSHPMSQHPNVAHSPKFDIRDVSRIFGEAIARMLA